MTSTGSGKAAPTSSRTTDNAKTQEPQTRGEMRNEEQKLAKEAQRTIAERSPEKFPADVAQAAGDAGKAGLSDNEKIGSDDYPDVTADSVRKDLFEDAALTPVEKAERDAKK